MSEKRLTPPIKNTLFLILTYLFHKKVIKNVVCVKLPYIQ